MDYDNKIDVGSDKISVIIFSANTGLRITLRDGVKALGVTAPHLVESQDGCLSALAEHPEAWILMDTSFGLEVTAAVLAAARNAGANAVRPVYLVLSETETSLLYLALEYGVFKVRAGNVSPGIAEEDLRLMLDTAAVEHRVTQVLNELHELWSAGDWKAAFNLIEVAANLNQNHLRLKIAFIDTLILSGDLDGARLAAESLRDAAPSNLRITHTLVRVLMKQKNFPTAADLLVKAEKISGLNPDRLVALGECFLEMGHYKEARQRFDDALNVTPDSIEARSGKAKSDLLLGDMDQALQTAREIGSTVEMAKILNAAAVIATRTGQVDSAKQMYAQGITLLDAESSLAARVWFNLGLLHYRSKAMEQALRCFEEACKLDVGFKDACHNRDLLQVRLRGSGSGEAQAQSIASAVLDGADADAETDQIIDKMNEDGDI